MIKGCVKRRYAVFYNLFFFSAAGGCGPTADVVLRRLASYITTGQRKSYSPTLYWLRCLALLCLCGCHSSPGHLPDLLMIDLVVHEGQFHIVNVAMYGLPELLII